jgi:hypothetical protein
MTFILFDRRARAQPRNHRTELVAPPLVRRLLRSEAKRHERGDIARGQLEVRGQNAHNAIRFAIQSYVAADEARIGAEARHPDVVRENHELVGVGRRLCLGEGSSENRLPSERAEERRRHRKRPELLRLTARHEADAARREERRVLDRRRLRPPVDVVRNRDAGLPQPHQRVRVPDEHQPVGMGVGQRREQRLVDEAENRRIRPDPQRERQDGDDGEDRLLSERPERKSDVLHGGLRRSGAPDRFEIASGHRSLEADS